MARRTKYFYNPKSLSFEKVSDHRSYVLWRRFGATSLFVVLVVGLSFVISHFYVRFNMLPSQQNNFAVLQELETTNRQIEEFEKRLQDLEDKDINIYRSIFNVAPPKPTDFRGKDYAELAKLPNGKLLQRIKEKADQLQALAEAQEASFVKLQKLSKNRITAIDAIQQLCPSPTKTCVSSPADSAIAETPSITHPPSTPEWTSPPQWVPKFTRQPTEPYR